MPVKLVERDGLSGDVETCSNGTSDARDFGAGVGFISWRRSTGWLASRVAGPRWLGSEHGPPATVHWHQNCCSPYFTSCSPAPRATLLLQPRSSPTYVIHVCAGLDSLNWALSSFPRVTQHDLSTLRPSHHRPRMARRSESS